MTGHPLDKPLPNHLHPGPLYPPEFDAYIPNCDCGMSGEDCGGECGVPSLLESDPPFDPWEDA